MIMMLARMLVYVVVFVVVLLVHSTAAPVKHVNVTYGVDLCTRPSPDPCSPGGKWDPLLNKLVYLTLYIMHLSISCPTPGEGGGIQGI